MLSFCVSRSRSMATAALVAGAVLLSAGTFHAADGDKGETIVFMRHGEKPDAGLGQLNCKGLSRSLALPAVLSQQFGKPDAIFAPDPSKRKDDGDTSYDYIRPLATIEPTAIASAMPVDTSYGYDEIDKLGKALTASKYASSLIFVAWEHKEIDKLVKDLLKQNGGDRDKVPKWSGDDFDSLYVLTIPKGKSSKATFELKAEQLNSVPATCPK